MWGQTLWRDLDEQTYPIGLHDSIVGSTNCIFTLLVDGSSLFGLFHVELGAFSVFCARSDGRFAVLIIE